MFWDPYKTLNAKRAPCRIFGSQTRWCVKKQTGFKRLNTVLPTDTVISQLHPIPSFALYLLHTLNALRHKRCNLHKSAFFPYCVCVLDVIPIIKSDYLSKQWLTGISNGESVCIHVQRVVAQSVRQRPFKQESRFRSRWVYVVFVAIADIRG
jgi:hypothetical protein